MRRIPFCALVLLISGCTSGRRAESGSAKFEPPDGKTLVIVGQHDASSESYVQSTGRVPAGFMFYTSIQLVNGLGEPYREEGTTSHAQHFVNRYPDSVVQLALYMVDAEQGVAAGDYDENIDRLAAWIRQTRRPVFFRIGYEFDGSHNHYEPKSYIAAYRRIVDRFRVLGVDNVAYVWHSAGMGSSRPMKDWYPGDDCVDWIAVSYFNQNRYRLLDAVEVAREKKKPLMIAESTPQGYRTRFGQSVWEFWYKPYFEFVRQHDVKALCYINDNWESMPQWKGWGDARIEANPEIRARWLEEVSDPRYLHASPLLFGVLEHREPLASRPGAFH